MNFQPHSQLKWGPRRIAGTEHSSHPKPQGLLRPDPLWGENNGQKVLFLGSVPAFSFPSTAELLTPAATLLRKFQTSFRTPRSRASDLHAAVPLLHASPLTSSTQSPLVLEDFLGLRRDREPSLLLLALFPSQKKDEILLRARKDLGAQSLKQGSQTPLKVSGNSWLDGITTAHPQLLTPESFLYLVKDHRRERQGGS